MQEKFNLRFAIKDDLVSLYKIAAAMSDKHEPEYFEKCFSEQENKKRLIIVAEYNNELIGYAQLVWLPTYKLFKRLNIPEIQDINIIPEYRNKGFGGKLIDFCENIVKESGGEEIGIGVGLNSSYGAAQRLYIKKFYIPDGLGVCYDDKAISVGTLRAIDNLLTLKLIKKIKQ